MTHASNQHKQLNDMNENVTNTNNNSEQAQPSRTRVRADVKPRTLI